MVLFRGLVSLRAPGCLFGRLVGVHLIGLGESRCAAAHPVRNPELAGRVTAIGGLYLLEEMLHA